MRARVAKLSFRCAPSTGEALLKLLDAHLSLISIKIKMYKNEKSLVLKSSASALCNNLSVQVNQSRNEITYAVVHKSVVNLVSASTDGASVNHRQIVCKEPSASAVHGGTIVLQVEQSHTVGAPEIRLHFLLVDKTAII